MPRTTLQERVMALTDSQKISAAYKALLGIAETSTSRDFFEEPYKTGTIVTPDMIWSDAHAIPAIAPDIPVHTEEIEGEMLTFGTDGVVAYFQWLQMKPISGAPKAFYNKHLKNAITFNWDAAGSYVYRLRNAADFDIAFGVQDWVVDPVAGTLTFYGNNLASIGVSSEAPPKISFYKYVGRSGISSSGGEGGVAIPIADIDTLLYRLGFPTHTARFEVRGGEGNKVYTLPSIDSGGDKGTVLLRENLNSTVDEIGVIDGGEHQ